MAMELEGREMAAAVEMTRTGVLWWCIGRIRRRRGWLLTIDVIWVAVPPGSGKALAGLG